MASKSKVKQAKSPASGEKISRKSAKIRDSKSQSKEEIKDSSLAFKVLSSSQTKEFLELETVDDVETKMAEVIDTPLHRIDLKDAVLLDYYTGALWWGREQGFTVEQLSAFFTLVHTLISNVKEKQMTLIDNVKEFKQTTVGIGQEDAEQSGGLECFDVMQAKAIATFVYKSIFQHYKMYEYVFSTTQAEEIIGTDLNVEIALASDTPWPPPLEEAIDETLYSEYVSTTGTPNSQNREEDDSARSEDDASRAELRGENTETELSQREADLLSQLSAEEVKRIMNSVMGEMIQGLQEEVAQKLREKENAFLARINKVHKVADKK